MPTVTLQRLLTEPAPGLRPLYVHGGGVGPADGRAALRLAAGETACFDTLFGALFVARWRDRAQIGRIALRGVVEGAARVRLLAEPGARVIAQARCSGAFALDAGGDSAERLWAEIVADEGSCVARDLVWQGDVPAVAPARLAVGVCAFGHAETALANARRTMEDPAAAAAIARYIVVDQRGGDAGAPPAPGVEILRQGNFGGSGGFARVMLEALDTAGATHVVLMDDDVEVDPECLARAAAFASVAGGCALAGAMLDLKRPLVMHEAGALFDRRRIRGRRLLAGLDAGRRESLDRIGAARPIDYGAWFFYAAPLAAVRAVGLPLPLFINYDDVEYSFRLAAAGVATAALPGVAVWHLPGYAKPHDWRHLFNTRNSGLFALLHGAATTRRLAWNFVARNAKALAQGRRFRAAISCAGMEALLAGPEALETPPAAALRRIEDLRARPGGTPALSLRVAVAALRLLARGPRLARAYAAAAPAMTTARSWRDRLSRWSADR